MKRVPILGPTLVRLHHRSWNSSSYWEQRYVAGGNSGPGSYGRLAKFKAGFLNNFVEEHKISAVIEFGCGDGAQLKLARYPDYIGVDKSAKAIEMCRAAFDGDAAKRFIQVDDLPPSTQAELSLSLDVIYHLIEDSIFDEYMQRLFNCATRFVIVYASNCEQQTASIHVRHRKFTRWVEQNQPGWQLVKTIKNVYPFDEADPENTSFADFHVFARNDLAITFAMDSAE